MPFNVDDDEYVAKLLAQDAKKTSKTYDMVGLDAFNPKRSRAAAPKPNTNFLRNIIRQTDSHNAALLAREAEESNLRLRQMNRERDKRRTETVDRAKRRIEGRLSPPPKADDSQKPQSSRRGDDHGDDEAKDHSRERRKGYRDERSESRSRRHRDRSRERDRHKRRHSDSDDERAHKSRRLRDHRNDDRRHRDDSERENRRSRRQCRKSRQSYPRSPSRSRSRSPRRKAHRKCSRSRSPKTSLRSSKKSREDRRRTHTPASDSDPLEAIVGPLPPPPEPTVRSRGRGALKANNLGIESRFSTNYNPSIDMKPGSDAEDDWVEALEVMRDRERWKQQGADRLRAAGFKDEQVKKWEKGGDPLEEDVVWSKRGQDREWDRGKVVDEDGDIDLKADWGRLK